ncbi:MAG: hypothetical protein QXS25_03980 [Candidatus Nitrosocaldus sp.]
MMQRTAYIIGAVIAGAVIVAGYALNNSTLSIQDDTMVVGEAMLLSWGDGCYMLTGKAYEVFTLEDKRASLKILKNQLEAIDDPDALIIIGFEGYLDDINSFIERYEVKDTQIIKDYSIVSSEYSKYSYRFMQGLIKKSHLEEIVERLSETPEALGDPKNGVEATIIILEGAVGDDGVDTARQYSMYMPINQIPPDKVNEIIAESKKIREDVIMKALNSPGVIKREC